MTNVRAKYYINMIDRSWSSVISPLNILTNLLYIVTSTEFPYFIIKIIIIITAEFWIHKKITKLRKLYKNKIFIFEKAIFSQF